MEVNNEAVQESSEVLPQSVFQLKNFNHGFSSDAQPQQQQEDSIDPTFRLADTDHQSPPQHQQHQQQQQRHHDESHHETLSAAVDQQSPGHPTPDKVKKKGSGQGPRLRKACDGCSKRKVKVRLRLSHLSCYSYPTYF